MAKESFCRICEDQFVPTRSDQIYCRKTKIVDCPCCENSFSYICSRRKKIFCSRTCSGSYRQLNGELKDALEEKYGKGIRNPSQIPGHHSTVDLAKLNSKDRKVDRLRKMYPHLKNIEELVVLSRAEWAIDFLARHGSKPTVADYRYYFNLGEIRLSPSDKQHFDLTRRSYHEYRFQQALERFGLIEGLNFLCHRRFLRSTDGSLLELDFFIPAKMVAFEVQDFATHDRSSDSAPGIFGGFKAGPRYHEAKRDAAANFGILLVEIWENELDSPEALERTIAFSILNAELSGEEYQPYSDDLADFRRSEFQQLPHTYDSQAGFLPWWKKDNP